MFQWACGDRDDPMLCPRSYLWSCQQVSIYSQSKFRPIII